MSRPKRNILMFCDSDIQMSVNKFIFETKNWNRIWPAPTLAVAEALIDGRIGLMDAAVIIVVNDQVAPAIMAKVLKAHDIPFVIFFKRGAPAPALLESPHQGVFDTVAKIDDVINRLRTLCARRRGPKKHAAGVPLGDPIQLEARI